jgi:deoxycytidine triphosphate deaminase
VAERPPQSVLSDGTIRRLIEEGRIKIEPWDDERVQPASVDLRLGDSFRVFHNYRTTAIDLREPPENLTEEVTVGKDAPFVIHPGEFVLGRTLEWVELPDDIVARIEGKALALDTPIPTPTGWKLMDQLQIGDLVFDEDGRPTAVIDATEVMTGRECREVVFSDGTSLVCDLDHQWEVQTKYDRKRGAARVLTTREMEGRLRVANHEYALHVRRAAPVHYSPKHQPVDPYVLGAWIGDGTSTQAIITTVDEPILREFEFAGYGVRPATGPIAFRVGGAGQTRDPLTGRYTGNESLHSELRSLGMLGDNHIPTAYLQGSVAQRQALLEGLMDTDGYVDEIGRCELTTVQPYLADQYFELIASLGHRPKLAVKTAWLNGINCGPKYEIAFTPPTPVFRLPRKLARQKRAGAFRHGRAITAIRRVDSVPVRCIQVASPRGLYLATRSFIPTHNSSLGRLGLIVHATAGFCDPGWKGTLTLELNNLTRVPIKLYAGLPIAQLSFMTLDAPAERPYGSEGLGSHYQGQVAATESRYEGRPTVR